MKLRKPVSGSGMRGLRGYFHSVETFGTVDGPGMRYVLFLSGCTLACTFCHNRDTWEFGEQTISVAEVLADYEKYRVFYDSAGGLTVSGGEPLLQAGFVAELFKACRERGIHTALDTAGHCGQGVLKKVLLHTDLVMFSVKAATAAVHRRLTSHDSREIVGNLRLAAQSVPLIVRYVIIPGITDLESELAAFAQLINSLPGKPQIELLAYHQAGSYKWEQLGEGSTLHGVPAATQADVETVARYLASKGVNPPVA